MRVYLIEFFHDMKTKYGDMCLNRRPSKSEMVKIENDLNEAGFKGGR